MTGNADIELRAVDITNFRAVLKLKVSEAQAGFLWSGGSPLVNPQILADAAYIPGYEPRAVYADGDLVGLVVWAPFYPGSRFLEPAEPGVAFIDHLMVDIDYQGRGLGRRLVDRIIREFAQRSDCHRIALAVDPDNENAIELYRRAGFSIYGRDTDNDVLMEYRLHE